MTTLVTIWAYLAYWCLASFTLLALWCLLLWVARWFSPTPKALHTISGETPEDVIRELIRWAA